MEKEVNPLLGTFEGNSGKIELYSDKVVIIREGFMNKLYGHNEDILEIPIADISHIRLAKATALTDGYILFESDSDSSASANPYHDKKSVVFSKGKNSSAQWMVDKINSLRV